MEKKILLIDDEVDFTELAKTLLNFHNLDVDAINDPVDVEAAIAKNKYDLIVTDLMMPNIDGFALIEKMRKTEAYKKTPILVLSAKPLTDDERKFLLQQQVRFLPKPFEPNDLVTQITQILG